MALPTVFRTDLDEQWTTAADGDLVGSIRWEHDGTNNRWKCYKCVRYNAATADVAGVAGEVTYYYAAGGADDSTGYDLSVVTSDLTDSSEIGAGVLQAALADDAYGWIQIKGWATLSIELTAEADGGPLTPTGSADGSIDLSTAATDHICAVSLDASANIIICDFPF